MSATQLTSANCEMPIMMTDSVYEKTSWKLMEPEKTRNTKIHPHLKSALLNNCSFTIRQRVKLSLSYKPGLWVKRVVHLHWVANLVGVVEEGCPASWRLVSCFPGAPLTHQLPTA